MHALHDLKQITELLTGDCDCRSERTRVNIDGGSDIARQTPKMIAADVHYCQRISSRNTVTPDGF